MFRKYIGIFLLPMLATTSCTRPEEIAAPVEVRQLTIDIENVVDSKPLALKTTSYKNANGDSYTVSTYKYYISNLVLETDAGVKYAEPESYHLVDEAVPASKKIVFKDLPEGKYTKLHLVIGVDSLRNVSGSQTGDLDPAKTMFWTWQTGYIMAKFEGTSLQAGTTEDNLGFHIGGFSGPENALKNITLNFPQIAEVGSGKNTSIHLVSDLNEWFKTPNTIDFSKTSFIVSPGEDSKGIADNYVDMFKVDHVD
jgi:hypothetical protein